LLLHEVKTRIYKNGTKTRKRNKDNGFFKDNGFYVIYDCFNKADKDCKTRDTWLAAFDFYIKKLCPQLGKRNFITVNINGKALAMVQFSRFPFRVFPETRYLKNKTRKNFTFFETRTRKPVSRLAFSRF
jgi:hypothetical protein